MKQEENIQFLEKQLFSFSDCQATVIGEFWYSQTSACGHLLQATTYLNAKIFPVKFILQLILEPLVNDHLL